jgi:SAM-dependent methyltransferase
MNEYTKINSETWDIWAENQCEWTLPITHEEYMKADANNFIVYLTPCVAVPHDWFDGLKGKKLLGLASGGGQQMPVFCKLGADATVFDYSDRQLAAEKAVSEREGYEIEIIKGDMTKRLPFADETFDIIFHPVSNCYVEDVNHIWRECFRVLRSGGVLLSGTDHFINYMVDEAEERIVNKLPFNPLKDEKLMNELMRTNSGVQFSHSLEEQITGQIKAGFILKDLYEDTNGCGRLHEMNIPTMLAMYSKKP